MNVVVGDVPFLEGHRPRRHLEDRDPERVDVGPVVDILAEGLFGTHVIGRPGDDGRVVARLFDDLREAEVHELRLLVAGPHRVGGLDVAVHDLLLVGVGERLADLHEHVQDARGRNRAAAAEDLLECRPLHVLHRDVVAARLLAGVVDRDDVRVVEFRGGLGLAHEVRDRLGVLGQRLGQDFEGDQSVEHGVLDLVDDAHPAPTELPDDLVATVVRALGRRPIGAPGHRRHRPSRRSARSPERSRGPPRGDFRRRDGGSRRP